MRWGPRFASLVKMIRLDAAGVRENLAIARAAVARKAVQKVTEFGPLIALVHGRELRAVLEIGTERGGTFYAWTRVALPDALLISLDWPEAAVQRLASEHELRAMGRERQQIRVVRGDSHLDATWAEVQRILRGRSLDLLFLDGDHSYEGVRRDFELYSPFVRQGGVVVFHDVIAHRPETGCEVERFWREIRGGYRWCEFVDPEGDLGFGPWGGIGVLLL